MPQPPILTNSELEVYAPGLEVAELQVRMATRHAEGPKGANRPLSITTHQQPLRLIGNRARLIYLPILESPAVAVEYQSTAGFQAMDSGLFSVDLSSGLAFFTNSGLSQLADASSARLVYRSGFDWCADTADVIDIKVGIAQILQWMDSGSYEGLSSVSVVGEGTTNFGQGTQAGSIPEDLLAVFQKYQPLYQF